MLSYVVKHSKQRKSTKVMKLQWIASIWCLKHQTNAKLQKWSYFDEFASIWRQNDQKTQNYISNQITINFHRFEVKTIKNFKLRRKTFKTTQNYESDQIIMNCIDLTSNDQNFWVSRKTTKVIKLQWIASIIKQSNMLSYVVKHSKLRKTTKVIKLQWIASIWHQNDLKCSDTSQNYKSDQIIMNCIDLPSKQSKRLSYVAKHSKQRKTTKVIKL